MRLLALVLTLLLFAPLDDLFAVLLPAQAADVQGPDDDDCLPAPCAEEGRPSQGGQGPAPARSVPGGRSPGAVPARRAADPSLAVHPPGSLYVFMSLRR